MSGSTIERISIASDGAEGDAGSFGPSISADGRFTAFESEATTLAPGDGNGVADIFVRDRQSGETTRVSIASDGTEADARSSGASISADGRFVAFDSRATTLAPDDANGVSDIFVHDRQTGETTRVSVASDGTESNGRSLGASISADGRFVAFSSDATTLAPGDTNGASDIFVHDRLTGETTRVSIASDGTQANNGAFGAAISADGRFVAFQSLASTLAPGDTNGASDIFVHDRQTGETTRISLASNGAQGDSGAFGAAISADGRFVAFSSESTTLAPGDTNGASDIFVHDRQTGETTRVSLASDGTQGNAASLFPAISADGRYVTFDSLATALTPDDDNGVADVFMHDRLTGTTARISVGADGAQADDESLFPTLSADGRTVAFVSLASNLAPGDGNGAFDVFVAPNALFGAVIADPDLPSERALEYFARRTAYKEGVLHDAFVAGEPPATPPAVAEGYAISRVFESDDGSFYAVALEAADKAAVLAVRGSIGEGLASANAIDWLRANGDPAGVGFAEVDAIWDELWAWLSAQDRVSLTGHSQGGAQAQIIATRAIQAAAAEENDLSLGRIVTFNAPGVDSAIADGFAADKAASVTHYISSGDLVSHAGARFLPGVIAHYDFDALAPGSNPLSLIDRAHLGHWAQPALETSDDNGGLPALENRYRSTTALSDVALNSPQFSHLTAGGRFDAEFFLFLNAVARIGPAAAPLLGASPAAPVAAASAPALAAAFASREGVESLRTGTGAFGRITVDGVTYEAEAVLDAFAAVLDLGDALDDAVAALGATLAAAVATGGAWAAVGLDYVAGWSQAMWRGFAALETDALAALRDVSEAALTTITAWDDAQWGAAGAFTAELWTDAAAWDDDVWRAAAVWDAASFENVVARGAAAGASAATLAAAIGAATAGTTADPVWRALEGSAPFWAWATGVDGVVIVTPDADGVARHLGDGPAFVVGAEGAVLLESLAGESRYLPAGGETIRLNGGGNVVYGLPATLDGATIEGFGPGDRIDLPGLILRADAVSAAGPAALGIDGDGDGVADATLSLPGVAEGALFAITGDGPDTAISLAGATAVALPDGGARYIARSVAGLQVVGGSGADVIVAGDGADVLTGGGGSNLLVGGAGDDLLIATGGDTLRGGAGRDRFAFDGAGPAAPGVTVDFIDDFTPGEDVLALGGFDAIKTFDDLTFRPLGADLAIELGAGRLVVLRGLTSADALSAADVAFAAHAPRLGFVGLTDGFRLTAADERFIYRGALNLDVEAVGGANVLVGGSGADRLAGGSGSDLLVGGAGPDRLIGGPGGDNLAGGPGADAFVFSAADATPGRPALDVIEDFTPGEDTVEINGFDGLSGFDDLVFISLGADLGLRLGDAMIVAFRGIGSRDALGEGDFLFG